MTQLRGYIKLHRNAFEHYLFQGDAFSRRDAWLWLISNAAWKPHKVLHAGQTFVLERGQIIIGRAHLAKVWGWGEQKVRNFIASLEQENMLKKNQSNGRFANVATICNYDKYQQVEDGLGPVEQPDGNQLSTSWQPDDNHTKEGKEGKEKKEIPPLPPKGGVPALDVLEAFDLYNQTALRCGIPQASKLTPARQKAIGARLREYGMDGWKQALANIERSSFLTGSNDRGWTATLDYLTKAASFGKVHDGGFGNGRHAQQVSKRVPDSPAMERLREAREIIRRSRGESDMPSDVIETSFEVLQ